MSTYVTYDDGCAIHVDLRGQRLHAEIDDSASFWHYRAQRKAEPPAPAQLTYTAKDITVIPNGTPVPAPLYPSVAAAELASRYTPAFALLAKGKAFDDRLVATIENALHHGVAGRMGRSALVQTLRARLGTSDSERSAAGLLEAAASFLGNRQNEEEEARPSLHARRWLARYQKQRLPPMGIWSSRAELAKIFDHDRVLAMELEPPEVATALATALAGDESARDAYRLHLDLAARLCGPAVRPSLLGAGAAHAAVYPSADSAESRLMRELFGVEPVPAGFQLIPEIIARVRDGRMSLAPRAQDGWYAHQQHAIAALLDPGSEGLRVGPRYRRELELLFTALFGMLRETHVKQLDCGAAGGRPIYVRPRVTVEPLPELYRRVADAYVFVRQELARLAGDDLLQRELVDAEGETVAEGLDRMESLLRGAWATSCQELGRPEPGHVAERAFFLAFQQGSASDPDLAADQRMMVPLYYDLGREKFRVLAVLGLETKRLDVSFETRPNAWAIARDGSRIDPARLLHTHTSGTFVAPVTAELDVSRLLNREQFRELCDREGSVEAIRLALV